jgi:hypothetical protein
LKKGALFVGGFFTEVLAKTALFTRFLGHLALCAPRKMRRRRNIFCTIALKSRSFELILNELIFSTALGTQSAPQAKFFQGIA